MRPIIFYRILGNDLPPRHSDSQTEDCLRFTLTNEPPLRNCEKRFVLNNIVDEKKRRRLLDMISEAGFRVDEIRFNWDVCKSKSSDIEKNEYVTNINLARNFAIDHGLQDGRIVLPFDGQTYFTSDAWESFHAEIASNPNAAFYILPMHRVVDNAVVLQPDLKSRTELHVISEPQVAFTRKSDIRFKENIGYGKGCKIELLMRLGHKGPWDTWHTNYFHQMKILALKTRSNSFGKVPFASYVYRLFSGNLKAEQDIISRREDRKAAVTNFINLLNRPPTE